MTPFGERSSRVLVHDVKTGPHSSTGARDPHARRVSGRSLARQKRQSGGLESAGSTPAVLTKTRLVPEGKFAKREGRLERDAHGPPCEVQVLCFPLSCRVIRKRNWLGARTASKAVRTRKGVGFETSLFLSFLLVLVALQAVVYEAARPGSIPGGETPLLLSLLHRPAKLGSVGPRSAVRPRRRRGPRGTYSCT